MEEWVQEWVQVTNNQALWIGNQEPNPSSAENPACNAGFFKSTTPFRLLHRFVEQAFTVMESVAERETALQEKDGETRVFGVVYEVEDDNADTHSHELYLVTWDGRVLTRMVSRE